MFIHNSQKFILFVFVILFCAAFNKFNENLAQTPTTIYTPLGSLVLDTYLTPEFTPYEIQYWNQYYQNGYPNATFLASSSNTYNCHAYAWHISQGGGNCWLGAYTTWAEDIYWQDGSYAETTPQGPQQKVSYLPDWEANHSAITTSSNNIFKSKWGYGPLMQHAHNYCPFYYQGSTTFKFYYNPWPTGVEDYIEIILQSTHFNVNQMYVGSNTTVFHDEWPYGDYIVSWGPWKIEAYHPCGKILVFEYPTSGYINVPSLPDGYLWNRDGNGNVLAIISTSGTDNTGYTHYASVPITIGNVPNTYITQGTLTSNTNWSGCVTITGNITVPSGITLTIHPNSIIVFQNNASLIVNGILNAQLCELRGGSTTWGSITFNGSGASSSVLNQVTIRNGLGIRCLNGANVIIQYSVIQNCTEGIYIYNSQPQILNNQIIEPVQNGINADASGLSPLIINNTIAKTSGNPQYHQYQGIILGNNTNGYIAHNDVSGFMWGMYIGGGSDAYFTNYAYQLFNPNNRVRDNSVGVGAGWGGYVMAGTISSYGRNNSIYNNYTNDARSYKNSVVYAQCNWWGNDGAQIYKDATSTLDVQFPLASDPWNQGPPPGEEGMNIIINNNDSPDDGDGFNPDSSVLAGIYLEAQERIVEAVLHYKQMVMNDNHPGFALGRLVGIKNRYHIQNIRNYLENLLIENRPYKPIVMTLFAGILLGEDKYNLAMLLYSQIINQYPNTYYSVNALFEKFFAALNYENDRVLAEQLLQELMALGLTDEEFIMRLQIAENLYNTYGLENFTKSSYTGLENNESEIVDHYSLSENFPNPFNPTTSIKYQIPKAGNVTLKIYDILGSEIATLVDDFKETGRYEVNFNASSLASGVYIYRINVNDYTNVKKMVLLK